MNGRTFPERSNLSWTRTAIELALVSMLLLRWARVYGVWVFLLIGLLLTLCIGIAATQRARYDETRRGAHHDDTSPRISSVVTVTVTLVLLGVGGVALVLVPLPGGVGPGW